MFVISFKSWCTIIMKEGLPNNFEKGLEPIPTPEEVHSIFERLVGEKKFVELRKLEDSRGLYLWEISIFEEGGNTEYSYMRKGQYKEGSTMETVVSVVFLDSENMSVSGHSVAKLIDGNWKLTP